MRVQLLQLADGSYQTIVHDETKLIPDPKFARAYNWHADQIDEKGENESQQDFEARAAAAREDYRKQIQLEAERLYLADMAAVEGGATVINDFVK